MTLRALKTDDVTELRKGNHPGSYCFEPRQISGLYDFVYLCPCGCGLINRLLVGKNNKPSGDRPSWRLTGHGSAPTLDPSVNMQGHWHGWLRNGYWESC